ncbi:hypothetical protein RvY_16470 [Ramazzottius varieornatus]|uniref:Uncharacterized protein n=1 Tax=Ramazzottius varieornatus TaxID=947166 RepID=A0A1D1W4Z7_RAMVA|nr:hypothetical protein RvY_16470 [Ramazzottius varieornatus]
MEWMERKLWSLEKLAQISSRRQTNVQLKLPTKLVGFLLPGLGFGKLSFGTVSFVVQLTKEEFNVFFQPHRLLDERQRRRAFSFPFGDLVQAFSHLGWSIGLHISRHS